MSLYDILACPICKTDLHVIGEYLHCIQCARRYPIVNGVPVLLPDWEHSHIQHEGELTLRRGYDPWIHRMIMQSLTDDQVIVDAGCGDMTLDDPCIIRMDIKLTPYVDVVGDLHALPFRPASITFIFALAVFEHLRQPFVAAKEIYDALKPGGYVYAESNFVFPYHGYPHHYFNASVDGLRQLFSQFTELRAGVAPYQMPSFAMQSFLETYLSLFKAETPVEAQFASTIRMLLSYPIRRYDAKFAPDTAFKVAAGDYFLGIKQPNPGDTIIPPVILSVYQRTPALQSRYPNPNDLAAPDNLMLWAKVEGCQQYPEIAAYFTGLRPFSKYTDPARLADRSWIKNLPAIPAPEQQRFIDEQTGSRSMWKKIFLTLTTEGPVALVKKALQYLR